MRKVGGEEKLKNKSKQHYSWWSYIKEIVRDYPEAFALPTSGVAAREVDAVSDAVYATERMDGGEARLKMIRMVHWDRTHTLAGAALEALEPPEAQAASPRVSAAHSTVMAVRFVNVFMNTLLIGCLIG